MIPLFIPWEEAEELMQDSGAVDRIVRGYSLATNEFNAQGERIWLHWPMYQGAEKEKPMRASWRFFHEVWAGEN